MIMFIVLQEYYHIFAKESFLRSSQLQYYLDILSNWLKDWRIKANESKSVHVTFTLKRETCPPIRNQFRKLKKRNTWESI